MRRLISVGDQGPLIFNCVGLKFRLDSTNFWRR